MRHSNSKLIIEANSTLYLERSLQSIGEAIRRLRVSRGMTLAVLSDITGLSLGALSQIERGQGNPTFETLLKLSIGLNVPVTTFFEGQGSLDSQVVRRGDRKRLIAADDDRSYELLTPDTNRALEMLWIVLKPGVWTEPEPHPHKGEECGVVIKGCLEAHIGEEVVKLYEGDSIYTISSIPHRYYNPGPGDMVGIWASTPPSY